MDDGHSIPLLFKGSPSSWAQPSLKIQTPWIRPRHSFTGASSGNGVSGGGTTWEGVSPAGPWKEEKATRKLTRHEIS